MSPGINLPSIVDLRISLWLYTRPPCVPATYMLHSMSHACHTALHSTAWHAKHSHAQGTVAWLSMAKHGMVQHCIELVQPSSAHKCIQLPASLLAQTCMTKSSLCSATANIRKQKLWQGVAPDPAGELGGTRMTSGLRTVVCWMIPKPSSGQMMESALLTAPPQTCAWRLALLQ